MQANKISMLDTANGFKFSLKLPHVVWIPIVNSLNCHWSGILQYTLVHCARSTIPYNILLIEILSNSHYIIKGVYGHIHVKDYKCRRTWKENQMLTRLKNENTNGNVTLKIKRVYMPCPLLLDPMTNCFAWLDL